MESQDMAKAPLKLRAKEAAEEETAPPADIETAVAPANSEQRAPSIPERQAQKRATEPGRFWLQIDRQTKSSYETAEQAAAAGYVIKKSFSMVQVAVYDRKEGSNTILELPA
jgi:hypothetical protein